MPKFSIIIPVYNVAPYLRECLDSVLAQTFADWEAICVDDGSTDESGAILDEYAAKDTRFKVLHRHNAGVSVARNIALDVLHGEWFLFLDSDDCIRENALQLIFQYTSKNDAILVYPYVPCWNGNTIPASRIIPSILVEDAKKDDLIFGRYAANGLAISRIYKSSVFRGLKFPVGVKMAEDIHFWVDALCFPARWAIINAEYYLYRQRPDSVCGKKSPKDCVQVLQAVLYACEKIVSNIQCEDTTARRYIERWPYSSTEYLDIFIRKYRGLSIEERNAVFAKLDELTKVVGRWPFGNSLRMGVYLVRKHLGFFVPIYVFVRSINMLLLRFKRLFSSIKKNGLLGTCSKIKRYILPKG